MEAVKGGEWQRFDRRPWTLGCGNERQEAGGTADDGCEAVDIADARHYETIHSVQSKQSTAKDPADASGVILREDFLPDYGLTVSSLAEALGVSRQTINELTRERRSLSPELAIRLSRLFGNTPQFWLNAQQAVDLWDAARAVKADARRI